MGGFAWVTLATNDSYSLGALVLANSLRRVNTAHQLVVLITPGVTEAMKTQLSAVFNVVKLVDVLDSGDADNLALLARPELGITFTKLHCWKLTQYDKCVFLDADTLVLQNSDELFEREELSAAPDAGWPDCFNSGVFVYKPSIDTFNKLIEFALIHGSFDGGDQGLLNLFFSDWATKDIKKHLPFVYNMVSTSTYSYLPAFKQFGQGLKIIHFIGSAKPWLQPFNTETGLVQTRGDSQHVVQFVQLWWDIFCTHVHPSLSTEMAGLAGALASVKLGAPLSAEQAALEDHLRRQGWEQGNIDYMGKDSFFNIWQKICDTLASTRITPAETPAPVAPVAAPTYVSSVEISPSGPIDTSPPASYAPVSSSKSTTVVASDTDAAPIKAASAETATVVPETKSPSVTELVSSPAAVDSSDKTQPPSSQASSETSIPLTSTTPADSKTTDSAPAALLVSADPLGPKVQTSNTVVSEVQPPIVSSPEVHASTTTVEKAPSQVSAPEPDKIKVTEGPTQIQSVQAPIPLPVTPTETVVQTPVPLTSTQTETLVQTSVPLTSSPTTKIPDPTPSTPTETPIQTPIPLPETPTTVSVPVIPVESPVCTTPLPKVEPPATQSVPPVPESPQSPKDSAPPTPVKTVDLPLTPLSTPSSPQSTPVGIPDKTQAQPQTPTVTEPTPPTSPPIGAVESPLAAKLQVEADVPATPPVGGSSSQPALSNVPSEEPPVPPKRKGGSKSTQEVKGHKGKPAKGKK